MRSFGVPAIVLAAFYVACTDPPKLGSRDQASAGTGAIDGASGGSEETGGGDTITAGTSNQGEAGENGEAGDSATGGTSSGGQGSAGTSSGGRGGGTANAGTGGTAEASGGSGGLESPGGNGGAAPGSCTTTGVTTLPVPPTTTVAKPSGAVGGLKVVNWAGFKGAISYTFDDSLASQVAHYTELNAVGVPMTFFVVCQNAKASTSTWAKAVADGHELGNHTYHHCNQSGTSCGWGAWTSVDQEIDECTTYMKSTFGLPGVYTFAAPNGDPNWATPASARFMLNRGVSDFGAFPNDTTNAYGLPCHIAGLGETAADIPGPPLVKGFNSVTDDARAKGSWRIILAHNVDPAINDYGYNPVKLAEVVATMTYTKGLGDVWADTMVSIGSYFLAQKAMNNLTPATVGSDKVYSWTLPAHFPPGHHVRVTVTGGTVKQCGNELPWDAHGYYEIDLDAGSLTVSP